MLNTSAESVSVFEVGIGFRYFFRFFSEVGSVFGIFFVFFRSRFGFRYQNFSVSVFFKISQYRFGFSVFIEDSVDNTVNY